MSNLPQNPINDEDDNKRMMLAIVVSLAILFAFNFMFKKDVASPVVQEKAAIEALKKMPVPAVAEADKELDAKTVLSASDRIPLRGNKITGSISLTGSRIDNISLNDHYTTVENKEHVSVLYPYGTANAYYVESGWVSADNTLNVPNGDTKWRLSKGSDVVLKSDGEISMEWDNGQGFLFKRKITLDENYMMKVTQTITNNTGVEKNFNAWHLISRHSLPPEFQGMFILHEGPLAYFNGKIQDPSYKKLAEGKEMFDSENLRGWFGITDKYWFTGILPDRNELFSARIMGVTDAKGKTKYQADMVSDTYKLLRGKTIEDKKLVYVGVKNLDLAKAYQKKYGIEKLDLIFDFGIYYFITKPFFLLLHFFMNLFGNVGVSIIVLTIVIRGAMFPLANKSFRSMAKMKQVSPQLKELQEKYKDNKEKLQTEIFELYKREGTNPFSGCWPLLVQIPIFFSLYKCILLSVELRHAPFWGWIKDLSAPDPTNLLNLFGWAPWDAGTFFHIGAWPVIFCITMIWQKRLSPPQADETQEQIQNFMPYFVTIMLAKFSVGLVIYWTWSNVLGLIQQYYIMRSMGNTDVCLVRGHIDRRKKKVKDKG